MRLDVPEGPALFVLEMPCDAGRCPGATLADLESIPVAYARFGEVISERSRGPYVPRVSQVPTWGMKAFGRIRYCPDPIVSTDQASGMVFPADGVERHVAFPFAGWRTTLWLGGIVGSYADGRRTLCGIGSQVNFLVFALSLRDP